jgi:hypothetical protein
MPFRTALLPKDLCSPFTEMMLREANAPESFNIDSLPWMEEPENPQKTRALNNLTEHTPASDKKKRI